MLLNFLTHFTADTNTSEILLSLAIVLCAAFAEDVTTVVVGVLAADGLVDIPLAFLSIYAGIAIGDTALYSLGAFARSRPWLADYIEHDFTASFKSWLEQGYAFKAFSGHFIPGFRMATYAASGFFRFPLKTYIPMAIAGGLVLETTLFTLSYLFGSFSTKWAGELRWGVAAVFVLVIFTIARHNMKVYKERETAPLSDPQAPQEPS